MPSLLITDSNTLTSKEHRHHRTHAIVGLYVLVHFIYRYARFFMDSYDTDMGFETRVNESNGYLSSFHPIVFFPHLLVQMSGFGFKIPKKRHPDGNRIWPQYRVEALVFFLRCMALLSLAWYRKKKHARQQEFDPSFPSPVVALVVVIATMLAADTVTNHYRKLNQSSRTIRDLHGPPGVLYLMSSAQFHATLHSLMTNDRLSVQLSALTVVQLSAFGMTLRRKQIITQKQGLILYGLVLVLGMVVILNDLRTQRILYLAVSLGNFAALLRFEIGLNKYVLWFLMSGILNRCSGNIIQPDNTHIISQRGLRHNDEVWQFLSIASTVALLLGATKRQMNSKST